MVVLLAEKLLKEELPNMKKYDLCSKEIIQIRELAYTGVLFVKEYLKAEIIKLSEFGSNTAKIFLVMYGFLNHLDKKELQFLAEITEDFENWICNQIFKEYDNLRDIWSAEELKARLCFNNHAYFDLLANLADLGYALCKKKSW